MAEFMFQSVAYRATVYRTGDLPWQTYKSNLALMIDRNTAKPIMLLMILSSGELMIREIYALIIKL